jgi:hypothetical protein
VGCIVSIDVAKTRFVVAIATAAGDVLKLVKFEHPRQTAVLSDNCISPTATITSPHRDKRG